MELYLEKLKEKLQNSDFIKKFIKELGNALEKGEYMGDRKLTNQEELEFERRKFKFLQEYFKDEQLYIVTNKYENDTEYHRYKVAQYKNNMECKYIAFEKDLPENVKLGDVVRKQSGKYYYDEEATLYVNDRIKKIKEDILT